MNAQLQEAQRGAMVMGFRAGRTTKEIAEFNQIPLATVKGFKMSWEKYLEDGGDADNFDIKRKPHKRRSDGFQEDMVDNIQAMSVHEEHCKGVKHLRLVC